MVRHVGFVPLRLMSCWGRRPRALPGLSGFAPLVRHIHQHQRRISRGRHISRTTRRLKECALARRPVWGFNPSRAALGFRGSCHGFPFAITFVRARRSRGAVVAALAAEAAADAGGVSLAAVFENGGGADETAGAGGGSRAAAVAGVVGGLAGGGLRPAGRALGGRLVGRGALGGIGGRDRRHRQHGLARGNRQPPRCRETPRPRMDRRARPLGCGRAVGSHRQAGTTGAGPDHGSHAFVRTTRRAAGLGWLGQPGPGFQRRPRMGGDPRRRSQGNGGHHRQPGRRLGLAGRWLLPQCMETRRNQSGGAWPRIPNSAANLSVAAVEWDGKAVREGTCSLAWRNW